MPNGREYWRSLDEFVESPAFAEYVANEFPSELESVIDPANRRTFLKLMGASLALAGASLSGCRRWPDEKIAPFAHRPENYVPGEPVDFATSLELGGYGRGVVVKSFDGRPVKIEGNELHPMSLGSSDAIMQGAILEFYDPERSRTPIERSFNENGEVVTAEARDRQQAETAIRNAISRGRGVAVLSGANASVTLAEQRQAMQQAMPDAEWFEYESISRDNEIAGARMALGGAASRPHYDLANADVIVALDSDFLVQHPAAIPMSRAFADNRRRPSQGMSRLYSVEGTLSITGANADHRLPVRSADVATVAVMLANQLGSAGASVLGVDAVNRPGGGTEWSGFVEAMAADLAAARGKSLVIAGPRQPAAVHALVHAINFALGNVGKTVRYTAEPDGSRASHIEALRALTQRLNNGQIDTLIILGGNPAYDAPADFDFATAMMQADTRIHLSLYDNETSARCTWHVNAAHELESWGDTQAYDGTIAIVQPLMEPLYDGMTPIELVHLIGSGGASGDGYELVRNWLRGRRGETGFEAAWRTWLHDGVLADSAWPFVDSGVRLQPGGYGSALTSMLEANQSPAMELIFAPDPALYDGRFANNAWLQELPDPIAKICWDNAAFISPATAAACGVRGDDLAYLDAPGLTNPLNIVVHVVPWHADNAITVKLGYGRTRAGRIGNDVGFNISPARRSDAMHFVTGVALGKSSGRYELATVQDHHVMDTKTTNEGKQRRLPMIVREARLDRYVNEKEDAFFEPGKHPHHPPVVSLWEENSYADSRHRWGMVIDLNACIGCSSCMVACQAENNIPVVGKDQVARGREMHWIRVDRYFKGRDLSKPEVVFQPVTCQHCENAPCEQVCPVAATVHDTEGLNVMVYNRCVGTRYCSNNCPYKVRRFNFYNWHLENPREPGLKPPSLLIPDQQTDVAFSGENAVARMKFNPDVTVRMRGVMEKCSFCVQRINRAKIKAKNAWVGNHATPEPQIADGTVTPACAQACPTQALIFGDLNDTSSRVLERYNARTSPRAYSLLEELNAKPRTRFLGKVRNYNNTLKPNTAPAASAGHNGNTSGGHTTDDHTQEADH
ncbi:MAG: TAT-variant-translocated molybdopterin oxidoreductase [Phycisphaerales bacterium]